MIYKWNVIGHKKQLAKFEQEISQKNLSHAYLFSGPKQIGKFTIAKNFASILLCKNNFCKTCKDCKLIQTNSHPEVTVLKDGGESIKINDIRKITEKTSLTTQGVYKIIILENIERMPIEAQNSFLKTLEEPTEKTIFLLTTNTIDHILPTIQSRIRHYDFSTIGTKELKDYLEDNFNTKGNTDEILNMAQGRPGLAISLLTDENFFNEQKNLYMKIENFFKRNDLPAKFMFIEEIEKDPEKIKTFIDVLMRYLRKLIFEYTNNKDYLLKKRFQLDDIINMFDVLEKTRYFIEGNVNKKLALENLLLKTEK